MLLLRLRLLIAFAFAANVLVASANLGVYVDAKAISEPVAVQQMIEGWERSGVGERAQAKVRTGTAFKLNMPVYAGVVWSDIGVEKRWDYYLKFSRDTARFYGRLEAQSLDEGRYPLDLNVNGLEAKALYVTFSQAFGQANWYLRLNLLKGQAVQYGSLKGEGEVLADGGYSFEYDLDYQYSRDQLLKRQGEIENGYGYSIDAVFDLLFSSGVGLQLSVTDGLYQMHWQNVSRSEGCLFRQRVQLTHCDQNFVQDGRRDFVQALPAEYKVSLDYQSLSVGLQEWNGLHSLPLGWQFKNITLQYDVFQQASSVKWQQGEYRAVSIGLDHYDPRQAKYWQLSLKYFWI